MTSLKKILITTLLSLLILGAVSTLIRENTWNGFKYRFVLGTFNGFLPFLIGTIIYHFFLKSLSIKVMMFKTLVGQVVLGLVLSFTFATLFILVDYNYGNLSFTEILERELELIIGMGLSISIVYYLVDRFLIKKTLIRNQ